ncbi:MAG: ThuA domain-containing protein [Ferruginibacter sp.]
MMRSIACVRCLIVFSTLLFMFSSCSKKNDETRVLVFTKTAGYHHESIADGVRAIEQLGAQNKFMVDTTSDADWFTEDSLKHYSAVVFLSTTGNVLNNYQEADFERYIQAGGGYVGIHAATDCEYDWGWYGRLAGAYFLDHPGINDTFPNVQSGVLNVVDKENAATKHLPTQWKHTDEFYSFKKISKDIKVLMTIDEKSYHGGKNGDNHPMAWYHEYDGGRAFYTELGHTKETYSDENYLKHILAGIQYAIGENKELDFSKATTARVPEENRFVRTTLVTGSFFEPTEMTILPNLDILIAQRRGEIMLYKKGDSTVKQVGFLPVYFKTLRTPGVNAEEGVLGLKADPNFEKNHYVYIYYSPADTSVNRLSRFKFENDKLDSASEKVVLELYSQREICCHTGGSIAFDKDGLLYVSTGDNSTPFNEPKQPFVNSGYAPLDERPGHEQYDARRSSGNPNDLRGKILRIRVKEDGSYEIPDGNLYPKGQQGTRPEIYVQGNRNPYRISVDQKNSYLYWGEVGPDASNDSLDSRGPRGYDEINQARKAGFFGWPLFIGNNYPYHQYDYNSGTTGSSFDPAKPINASRNNTGIQQLPPAQPAFIWYPYGASADFPQVGTGGRNAMAGPVYYNDMFPKETRLPDYYNKKLFIYDWIRGWIKAVTLQPNGDFDKMEPFMENTKFNFVIDMEVGPDGKLYMLEYGTGWFTKNADAGLVRIDYNAGNRAPKINGIAIDKNSGALPFKVVATVDAADPEKDKLTYVWDLGDGEKKETTEPRLEYTYPKIGEYTISVTVSDTKKESTKSSPVVVYAGNETPVVNIAINGNKTFYFPGKSVAYSVTVSDKDDTATVKDMNDLFISADYIEGSDKAGASQGHQVVTESMMGKNMIQSLDCKACHKQEGKSVGPAYVDVAIKYQKDPAAGQYLAKKIISGGGGVWGETVMPAHPGLKDGEAKQIVAWIQSLVTAEGMAKKSLPVSGSVKPTLDKTPVDNGMLVISATYTDKGGPGIKPLAGDAAVALRNSKMKINNAKHLVNYTSGSFNGMSFVIVPKTKGSLSLDSIDLTGVTAADIMAGGNDAPLFGYDFELRLDGPDGKKLGQAALPAGKAGQPKPKTRFAAVIPFKIEPVTDGKLHNLYIVSVPKNAGESNTLVLQGIQFK